MGQASDKLRRAVGGYGHYCPGCDEVHVIPDSWTFNNNLDKPTFNPSVLTQGVRHDRTGHPVYDKDGKPIPYRCHYFLQDGLLKFCADCNHGYNNKTIELPALPDWLQDHVLFREA